MFAPPSKEESGGGMFAPPTGAEKSLFAPPSDEESGSTISPKTEEGTGFHTADIHPEELQKIASTHGVQVEDLAQMAPYYAGFVQGREEPAVKRAAGFLSESLGGIPTFIYKKLQSNPNYRAALDDLRDLAEKKKSTLQKGAELVAPIGAAVAGLPIGLPASAGIAGAMAEGAAYGLGGSHEGEELKSAALGATGGAILHKAAQYIPKAIEKFRASPDLSAGEKSILRGADIEESTQAVARKTSDSENIISDILFARKPQWDHLSHGEINTIVDEQLDPASLEKYLDPSTSEGKAIRQGMEGQVTEDSIKQKLANDVVEDRARGFVNEKLNKKANPETMQDALAEIENYSSRQGPEFTEAIYNRDYVPTTWVRRAAEEQGLRFRGDEPGWLAQQQMKLADAKFALANIDRMNGTRTESLARKVSEAKNQMSYAETNFADARKTLWDENKPALDWIRQDPANARTFLQAKDSGDFSALPTEAKKLAQDTAKYTDQFLDFVNDKGMQIPKRDNYFPHIARPSDEIVPIMEQKIQHATESLSHQLGRHLDDLSQLSSQEYSAAIKSGTLDDLNKFLEWGDNTARVPRTGKDMMDALETELKGPSTAVRLESRARAAMERNGEIPEFIQETDPVRILDRYSYNTLNHVYLRDPLSALQSEGDKLKSIGSNVHGEYINRLVQDTLGVRKGTAAAGLAETKILMSRKFDHLIDEYGKDSAAGMILTLTKGLPDLLYAMSRNIYSNVLGFWNIRAAMQHSVTGLTRIAPELGGAYGYTTLLRGAVNTTKNLQRNLSIAEKLGYIPAEFIRKGPEYIREGLMANKSVAWTADQLAKVSSAGMILFRSGEKWNRALLVGVADQMSHDLAQKSGAALNSLKNFPRDIQRDITAAIEAGDKDSIFRTLSSYLNDRTLHSYNRSAMFEYGRTLGPLFSTFSKWPTAISSEAIHDIQSRGLLKGSQKILTRLAIPYSILMGADYLLTQKKPFQENENMSDREKKIVGRRGFSKMAPAGALTEFTSGKIFTPPMVDLLVNDILKPVSEHDTKRLQRSFDNVMRNFAPGAGLLRFVTDDLVTYATGRSPEGQTFLERTGEGIHKMKRVLR